MRIVLTGFMGAGKSAVGRVLAEQLALPFFDLDDEVEKSTGKSIPEIFEQLGEAEFRRLELEALAVVLDGKEGVIAVGGGTLTREAGIRAVPEKVTTVWLDTPLDVIQKRLEGAREGESRPLYGDSAQVRALYEGRLDAYRLADLRIEVGAMDSERDVAEQIMVALEKKPCATS